MRLPCLAVAVAAPLLPPLALSLPAQQPIRVLRHAPADTARPGDAITISFDRPVAGSLGRTPDPYRIVHLDPSTEARIEWRDPTTLRIIPRTPFVPGRRYRVTLSNDFVAVDGGRLDAVYQFTLATGGPALLASRPPLQPKNPQRLEPNGRLRLVYSAPIDSAELERSLRIDIGANPQCDAQSIRYHVRTQRPITGGDDWELRYAGGWNLDSAQRAFHRVVEIRPMSPVPEGCVGSIVLPSLDPADRAEVRYPIATTPRFAIERFSCEQTDCAAGEHLVLRFTTPVYRDSLMKYLRFDPDVPVSIPAAGAPANEWRLGVPIAPRTTYRVRIDGPLTDVFARRLTGTPEVSVATTDRRPTAAHQLGFITASRSRPVVRLTHVNVDSVTLVIVPIPDSLRVTVADPSTDADSVARMIGRLRDTIWHRVATPSPFNTERITEVPIPPSLLSSATGSLFAIRARGNESTWHRRQQARVSGQLQEIEIVGSFSEPSRRTAIVQFTDLIAYSRVADDGGSVLVTDGLTGRPVPGARVTTRDVHDHVIGTGVTDASGVATIVSLGPREPPPYVSERLAMYAPEWYQAARLVEVVRGTDRSLTPTAVLYRTWGSTADELGGVFHDAARARASVFTDRGIYRPGEKIFVTSILRLGPLSALRTPEHGDSVRLRVTYFDPGEQERRTLRDTVLRVDRYGAAADSFALPRDATLGSYHVHADAYGTEWEQAAEQSFKLAEYRAPEFEVSMKLDSTVRFLGDTLTGRATARYYFGAPMGGAIVHWSAVTADARDAVSIPGLPSGFVVGETYDGGAPPPDWGESVDGVDTLDATGQLTLRIPTPVGAGVTPTRVQVAIAINDLNRQWVTTGDSVLMHASSFYIAARDSSRAGWYWAADVRRRFDVIAVRPDGKRVAGARITITTLRHRVGFTAQTDGSYPTMEWTTDTLASESVETRDSVVGFAFTPRETGWYELVFSGADERDRPVRTTLGSYVLGRQWAPWTGSPVRVAMNVDRTDVAPGDTLVVRFLSPFSRAEAWVTVEREGVLAQHRARVSGGESVVRIPVTDAFIPAAVVSVLVVDSGSVARKDSSHQRFRAGYSAITVNRTVKTLTVDVRPERSRHIPGDSARFIVAVRDHRSNPASARVTLWAVDEAVLALADYQRPNPLNDIHASQGTALRFSSTATSVASLGRFLSPPGWFTDRGVSRRLGMAAASSLNSVMGRSAPVTVQSSTVRTDFRSTAFYVASLMTDAGGTVTATVKLPDNLTTYRVMAVAVTTGDAYGSSESSIILTKPLLARPSLPRFLRTGDTILAGAVINNTSGDSLSALVNGAGARIERTGDTSAVLALAPGAGSEVRFNWRAGAAPGDSALFRFDVAGGSHRDAVQVAVPMRPPYAPRYHTVAGVARGQSTVRMMLPRGIDPARSRLTLRVGTSPIPIIQAAYARVDVYPYECSEQLTSTGQVLLAMLRLQRAGLIDSVTAPDSKALRGRLQFVVDELTRRQSLFGGIGYWREDTWTSRWLSSYAGTLLVDARAAGFRVDSAVIRRIGAFVDFEPDRDSLIAEPMFGDLKQRARMMAWELAEDLASLHFLRRAGTADTVQENRMLLNASRMVWEDRVWLAELLAARPDPSLARAQLARVWRDVELVGSRLDIPDSLVQTLGFRSHVRPAARLLQASLAIDPMNDRITPLVERIVQQGRAERDQLWNTQDYAALSGALADLAIRHSRAGPASRVTVRSARRSAKHRVLVAGSGAEQSRSEATLDGLLERDGEWMVLPMRIESSGAPTFYVVTVDEVPLTPPKAPAAKGMIVERWFERFDDGRPVTEVTEGDLVRGRLRVTVPSDREFVAVEDLLPAGLEVVDLSLRTTSLGPFTSEVGKDAEQHGHRANSSTRSMPWLYGSWANGWWSPWEHEEKRDDRVVYFARVLWKGTYTATYVARATTAGTFVRPPAHAEEMYNPSVGGRTDGGTFRVLPRQ